MAAQDDTDLVRGERVRGLRKALGKTVAQVAEEVGVTGRTVSYWEKGGTIRPNNLVKLATALDSTPKHIDPRSGIVAPRRVDGSPDDVAVRLNRQREILRRVAAQELLTAEQLEYLERALDELEHQPPAAETGRRSADEEAAA